MQIMFSEVFNCKRPNVLVLHTEPLYIDQTDGNYSPPVSYKTTEQRDFGMTL